MINTTEMANFTLECETSSDESSFMSNCIEEFSDSSDNDESNDGYLKATIIPTQVASIVYSLELVPILSPEIKETTYEVFYLAVSLKNGEEKLPYS